MEGFQSTKCVDHINGKQAPKTIQDQVLSNAEVQTPQARQFCGWTAQGINRYNQLFMEIKLERAKKMYELIEEYCLGEYQGDAEAEGNHNHKQKKMEPDKTLPIAKHELWDENPSPDDEQDNRIVQRLPLCFGGVGV